MEAFRAPASLLLLAGATILSLGQGACLVAMRRGGILARGGGKVAGVEPIAPCRKAFLHPGSAAGKGRLAAQDASARTRSARRQCSATPGMGEDSELAAGRPGPAGGQPRTRPAAPAPAAARSHPAATSPG